MKNTKILSLVLAAALAAGVLTGCGNAAPSSAASSAPAAVSSVAASEPTSEAGAAAIQVSFTVTGPDGTSEVYTLEATEGETLASALLDAGLISADEAAAGFVTTVNGVTANWDADQAWWSLVDGNGEMTPVGISDILLADGDSYAFVYTVG